MATKLVRLPADKQTSLSHFLLRSATVYKLHNYTFLLSCSGDGKEEKKKRQRSKKARKWGYLARFSTYRLMGLKNQSSTSPIGTNRKPQHPIQRFLRVFASQTKQVAHDSSAVVIKFALSVFTVTVTKCYRYLRMSGERDESLSFVILRGLGPPSLCS